MYTALIVAIVTCVTMILSILFFPTVKVFSRRIDTYILVALAGAAVMLISGQTDLSSLFSELTSDSAVNPLKILVLFLSMTLLSVYLDELGFFSYLAMKAAGKSGSKQYRLFFYLYIMVSVLTVFTSNDIIILTFTPFICYFAKSAKIDPLPYLVAEFVAANTWSMALIIGNPTNIYLATSYGVDFFSYVSVMFLPTVFAGLAALACLLLLFGRKLKKPMEVQDGKGRINDLPGLIIGLVLLSSCTLLMAFGSFVGIEMWLVSACAALLLALSTGVLALIRKEKPRALVRTVKRAPFAIVPFVLSMFVIVLALKEAGVTEKCAELLGSEQPVLRYGLASFFSSDVINNIPMSVFFSSVLSSFPGNGAEGAMYASVVGSNIGAILTPIGALAGIMWSSLLKDREVKFGYLSFVKYGAVISFPTLAAALAGLLLTV